MSREELFSAILTPHRSLGPRGFVVLMALIGGVSFVMGLVFYAMGAWPILCFLGLDVVLVYIAFRLNYRAGRLYETVELRERELVVTRVEPSGRRRRWAFDPYWARLNVEEVAGGQVLLALVSHGRRLVFGRFLSDEEKRDFANAFRIALSAYRAGAPA